jgi:hypothetical protein
MKMGRFEKLFVNSPSHGRRVTEHAEKKLRLAGFALRRSIAVGKLTDISGRVCLCRGSIATSKIQIALIWHRSTV